MGWTLANWDRTERERSRTAADLDLVAAALQRRTVILESGASELEAAGFENHRLLAATDLFVEKAQQVLTSRAERNFRWGVVTTIAIVTILSVGGVVAGITLLRPPPKDTATSVVVLRLLQSTGFGAFLYATVKYLIGLARSFFHENQALLNRRHSLRFGRLYVYLMNGNVGLADLTEAFQWNAESGSAFLHIDPSTTVESLFHKVLDTLKDAPPELLAALGSLRKRSG
jgi:hypothetical protein